MTPKHIPVLIVGAGFAGLTAALMISRRGIPCIAVERRATLSSHPRAHGLNLRSLELFRQIPGLEEDLHRVSRAAPEDWTILIAETVTGPPIKFLSRPGVRPPPVSPSVMCSAGQNRVEPVLLRHARELGAEVFFSTELASFTQSENGVRAVLRDTTSKDETLVTADYLIAGDGSGSAIRKSLGVAMEGPGVMSHAVSILFEADLTAAMAGRGFFLCYLRNAEFTGAFVSCDDPNQGQLNVEYNPEHESAADFDVSRCKRVVRAALGQPDLELRILDVIPWKMSAVVADRMRVGRVFLAGDAAHIMPPVGGLAGQAAIQDAVDLAWKISMTLDGDADPALLDTYELERRPVAQLAIARATENYVERLRQDRADLSSALGRENLLDVAMSYRYRSQAISLEEPDDGLPTDDTLHPSGKPGTRLAHVSLTRGEASISTHDLVGPGFVLLAGPSGTAWTRAADVLTRGGAPLTAFRVGSDLLDHDGSFLTWTGLEPAGALLVRPDGFIAWRSVGDRDGHTALLAEAMARALCIDSQNNSKFDRSG
ncbi:methanobactin biosynthesis FAD monooxygenase MbnF [Methylosinus sporium]|uniref:methanobactin biosynthesis FAD monooxygenase MbnF n=1 Tax=Methylosinus sporium TaxID=428 RepID=UPI000D5930AD|nr:methanobactin biosynthesis FAD monooxygenase MbnF [Methylosinus sporium]PWB88403.1 monooxygenase [Methylocystis sp. MitZ-2018]